MQSFLWLEGVDFAEHLFDTNDISIIRGGSLALLHAGEEALRWLKGQPGLEATSLVFTGASLALLRLPCAPSDAKRHAEGLLKHLARPLPLPEKGSPTLPFAHLRFVAGVSEDDGTAVAVRRAQAEARLAQLAGGYPRRAIAPAGVMCGFTRRLPADDKMRLNQAQVTRLGLGSIFEDPDKAPVSSSAKARRLYGRKARETVFAGLMGLEQAKGWRFTNDLHEMVEPPSGKGVPHLPRSVENKVAVFYADGNGFSVIRDDMGGRAEDLQKFSAKVRPLMEENIIGGILDELIRRATSDDKTLRSSALVETPDDYDEADNAPDRKEPRLRFELLLYGGDEICFIVPAWLGLDVARLFFAAIADEHVMAKGKERALHFKAGLVFAPYKMPIAAARNLAKDVAEEAKREGQSSLGVHAFESIEPPANGLSALRKSLFGDSDANDGGEAAAKHAKTTLAIPAARVPALIDNLVRLKNRGFPRSQLYRALRIAQWQPDEQDEGLKPRLWPAGLGSAIANRKAHKAIADYSGPLAGDPVWQDVQDAYLSGPSDAALNAWLLTHLWDYADPLGLEKKSEDAVDGEAA